MMMKASCWMSHHVFLLSLLSQLSSFFFFIYIAYIATEYSSHTFIAPTWAFFCWRVWRASPPQYGTCHCLWITCPTPFHSHGGTSFFLLLFPYLLTYSLGVCCWYHTRNSWIKTLFSRNQWFEVFMGWLCEVEGRELREELRRPLHRQLLDTHTFPWITRRN